MNYRKIAHITTIDKSLRYLILSQLESLRQIGYEVHTVSTTGPDAELLTARGFPHHSIIMTRRFTPWADFCALIELIRLFRREHFTLIHTHTPKANLLGQWAGMIANVSIRVATVHGLYFTAETPFIKRLIFQFMEFVSGIGADTIFLINEDDMLTARKLRLYPHARTQLMPGGLGIDLKKYDPNSISTDEVMQLRADLRIPCSTPVIGFVGRLVREKGILELLEAFRLIQDQTNALLLIVGPSDVQKPDAIDPTIAKDYGIADRCIFTGTRTDTPQLYKLMDIFVLPSHREGMPLAAMEAQAMGLPVVTTNARGCRESIVPGSTGLITQVGDPHALASALLTLLLNADLRHNMGRAAEEFARARFDVQMANSIVAHEYRRLLDHERL